MSLFVSNTVLLSERFTTTANTSEKKKKVFPTKYKVSLSFVAFSSRQDETYEASGRTERGYITTVLIKETSCGFESKKQ